MKKSDCIGCYDNVYNHDLGGAKECWSFDEKKKLEKRYMIFVELQPPYGKHLIVKVPPCYTKQKYCMVKVENIDSKGFWKR